MTSISPHRDSATTASHRSRTRALAVVAAIVAACVGWAIATLAGIPLPVATGADAGAQTIGIVPVIASSLVASLLGWALLALLEKRTTRARRIWVVVALIVLVLSLFGPITGAVTVAAKITLALLHVLVGAVLIPSLARTSPTT